MIKILLANDNKTLRKGIVSALKEIAPHIQIVDEAESFQDLLKKLPETEFDILMSDDLMEGEIIVTYLPAIKEQFPEMKILINTIFTEEVQHLKEAKEYSIGWISLYSQAEEFVEAIEALYNEGKYFPNEAT